MRYARAVQGQPPPEGSGEGERWLPPQPAGPAPGAGHGAPQPPPVGTPPAQSPPPAQPGTPPSPGGWPQQPGAPGPGQVQPGYPPWYAPPQPGNGDAIAGFVLGVVSLGLLLISFGLSTILSLGLSIGAIFLGRKGRQRVDRGETQKHRGFAQAGFITGLIGVPLSIAATAGWVLVFLSEDFQRGFEEGFEESNGGSIVVPLLQAAAAVGRALLG